MHSDTREKASATVDGDAVYTLTEEEEAALLAEFGVAGAFDGLLSIPAASQYRSEVNGDGNVFLTGGVAGAADEDTGEGRATHSPTAVTEDELLHDPLEILLMKYTSTYHNAAPNSFLDGTSSAISESPSSLSAKRQRSAGSHHNGHVKRRGRASRYLADLEQARAQERIVFRALSGWEEPTGGTVEADGTDDDSGDSTTKLLRESEALLTRADKCLLQPRDIDPTTDERVVKQLADIEKELAAETQAEVDDFLEWRMREADAEGEEVLRTTRQILGRHQQRKADSSVEVEVVQMQVPSSSLPTVLVGTREELEKREAPPQGGAPVPEKLTTEPSLFAFEMEPSREEAGRIHEWDEILQRAAKAAEQSSLSQVRNVHDDDAPLSLHIPASSPEGVLAAMDVLEGRQSATLKAIEAHYKGKVASAKTDAEERCKRRARQGLLVMDVFQHQMDRILPASFSTARSRNAAALKAEDTHSQEVSSAAITSVAIRMESPSAPASVIARRAERQLWAVRREALEGKRMRQEDQHMQRCLLHREQALEDARRALVLAQQECDEHYGGLVSEEQAAFDECAAKERRHRDLARRAALIRKTKAEAALSQKISEEFERSTAALRKQEAEAWAAIVREAGGSLTLAAEKQQTREAAELAGRVAEEMNRRAAFEERRRQVQQEAEHESAAHSTADSSSKWMGLDGAVSSREAVLAEEKDAVLQWVRKHKRFLQRTVDLITEELERGESEKAAKAPPPQRVATGESSVPSKDLDRCAATLDAVALVKRLPQQFANAAADPARAAQYFHTISLALEDLEQIDYASLRDCGVPQHPFVKVAALIRVLDLGSNRLTSPLSLTSLLRTFPTLEALNLSDNALRELSGDATAAQSALPSLSRESRPGSPSSPTACSSRLRGVSAAQRNALAEQCRVRDLDVSSNELSDLSSLAGACSSSLVTLRAFANRFPTLLPLQHCRRLSSVIANRNRITSLADVHSLHLLQELNLCDNDVFTVPDATLRENLLLTKLFLSQNARLTALPTGTECFLFLEQLFLNGCGLRSITRATFPWLPSLSILHMEGNAIITVTGLVKCPRLSQLNLAFNQLSDWVCVEPLAVCQRLRSLDLRGNPCMNDETDRRVRDTFPCLRELNNAVCERPQPKLQGAEETAADESSGNESTTIRNGIDGLLTDLRTSREVANISGTRRVRAAEVTEEHLLAAAKARQRANAGAAPEAHALGGVVGKQLSMEAKRQAYREDLQRYRECIQQILALADAPDEQSVNRHFTNPIFAERVRVATERRARRHIADFLCGVLLMRRAKAELAALRAAYRESEACRREMAARRIQPVWRGAVLRSRLARALKGTDADLDGDDHLQKVDLDFGGDGADGLRPATIAELLKHVMGGEGRMGDAGGGDTFGRDAIAFHRFDVPATVVAIPAGTQRGGGGSDTFAPRVGSAPLGAARERIREAGHSEGPHGVTGSSSRPSSEPTVPSKPGAPRPPRPDGSPPQQHPAAASPDAAWGATVAAQIHKKNRKMQRVHQEYVRHEFLHDPLNAKKLATDGTATKSVGKKH